MIPSAVLTVLDQSVDDLREKHLVQMEPEQVRSLLLSHGDTELQVDNTVYEGRDNWRLVKPFQARADEFRTEKVVSNLLVLMASGFVEAV